MDVPTFALPMRAVLITRFDSKPIKICCFVNLDVLDQRLELLKRKGKVEVRNEEAADGGKRHNCFELENK